MKPKYSHLRRRELQVEDTFRIKFSMKNDLGRKYNHKKAPVEGPENKQQAFKTDDQLEASSSLWPGGTFGAALGNFWKRWDRKDFWPIKEPTTKLAANEDANAICGFKTPSLSRGSRTLLTNRRHRAPAELKTQFLFFIFGNFSGFGEGGWRK